MIQAIIFCLLFPVFPLLVWRRYQKDKELQIPGRELLIRYAVYTLLMNLVSMAAMLVLCDVGTSFQQKMDTSPSFALKFAFVELMAAVIIAAAEWIYTTRRLTVRVEWQEYQDMWLTKFVRKFILPCVIYLTAVAVVILNVSLMFDNVLWGDECFSANTAQKSWDGILQVMYFWDNHPPLHYFWTKLFGDILGHTGPVYHLASLTPFFVGVILALVILRRHFGNIFAAYFIIITGLASTCLQYNLEIRMYSLAFFSVACCYYCAYRVLSGGKLAWFGMVFWALVGAYSHYYAMMAVGIMIFVTGVAAFIRYKGMTWIKGLIALVAYIAGYSPWFKYLFHATGSVSNSWWITEIMGIRESMRMILCGAEFQKIVFCLLAVFLLVLFVAESSIIKISNNTGVINISIHSPSIKGWSNETYASAVGVLTIVGTMIAAYVLCITVSPVLAPRYLYSLSAVTILMLVMSGKGCMELLKELGKKMKRNRIEYPAKCILIVALVLLFVIGIGNYKAYRAQVKAEKAVTEQTMSLIGEVPEDTGLVSNNVKHLAWTVLYYYFPDRDIVAGNCINEGSKYDRFWYFTPQTLEKDELRKMYDKGYTIQYYASQQIAIYPFELYYFER